MPIIYIYKGCDTCRKALKWLAEQGIAVEQRPIRETPPTPAELTTAIAAVGGDLRRLFNTSGGDYREMGLKDRLPAMTPAEAVELLSKNGNLVKRPFYIDGERVLTGFQAADWNSKLC
ncbi:MAG: ArsC family transcriptional regulator [Akkermansiaceae bacterium]|nr:ArsC family transcriptional regulator [Akkermansiaceae bacterium]